MRHKFSKRSHLKYPVEFDDLQPPLKSILNPVLRSTKSLTLSLLCLHNGAIV